MFRFGKKMPLKIFILLNIKNISKYLVGSGSGSVFLKPDQWIRIRKMDWNRNTGIKAGKTDLIFHISQIHLGLNLKNEKIYT